MSSPIVQRSIPVFTVFGVLALLGGCTSEPTSHGLPTLISGKLVKNGVALQGATVDLYDDQEYVHLDSTFTDTDGRYEFQGVAYGRLQIKRSSGAPNEFGYVRYIFTLNPDTQTVSVPTMDVSTFGMDLVSPAEGDSMTPPDSFNPLTFLWSSYKGELEYNSARLYNHQDSLVWYSADVTDTTASFNGIMNQGSFSGNQVGPGLYRWRVKVKFLDSTTAATSRRMVIFTQ